MFETYEVVRIVLGSIFVLFIPGFAWSYIFFGKGEIDLIERIALSFGLSIALIPLTVFWLNWLLHVPINLTNVTIIVVVLTVIPLIHFYLKHRKIYVKLKGGLKKVREKSKSASSKNP